MRCWLSVLFFGLVTLSGHHQAEADEGSALRAFMGSSYYAGLIHTALAALPPDEFRQCPHLVSTGSQVTILKPVAFYPNGFPGSDCGVSPFPSADAATTRS